MGNMRHLLLPISVSAFTKHSNKVTLQQIQLKTKPHKILSESFCRYFSQKAFEIKYGGLLPTCMYTCEEGVKVLNLKALSQNLIFP